MSNPPLDPSETTPLLGGHDYSTNGTVNGTPLPVPELASSDLSSSGSAAELTANETLADPAAVEGQNESAASSYGGLPEVRKRMKYIFGAMAIGVYLSAGKLS
jgi:hypothetical protein